MIRATFECPSCQTPHDVADIEGIDTLTCPCGWSHVPSEDAIGESVIYKCPVCSTEELYVQKDFPERVGMTLVVAGVVLATLAWAYYNPLATFGILFVFGAVDWILFHTRRNVTVCYRCLAQFRGMKDNPAHRAFDLAIGERFRQERLRRAEMRRVPS